MGLDFFWGNRCVHGLCFFSVGGEERAGEQGECEKCHAAQHLQLDMAFFGRKVGLIE